MLDDLLRGWGAAAVLAGSAAEAAAIVDDAVAASNRFDLLIVDAHMPGPGGYALVQEAGGALMEMGAEVIMLTSAGHSGERERCAELGIAAHLSKPLRHTELLRTIEQVTGRAAAEPVEPVARVLVPTQPLRLLVAEDNPVNQKLATRMLQRLGLDVDVASHGVEAVARGLATRYDAIFMDCQMPEMDGFEATRELRRREAAGRRTPILAMTANVMDGDRERCLAAGMDDHLAKPITKEALTAALDRWIGRREPATANDPAPAG
jgi:CheY-like chemotaxis protein